MNSKTKKKLGLTGTLATLAMGWGGYQWLNDNYTPLPMHQALASEVSIIKLQNTYENLLSEYYFQKKLQRKYPEDQEIKDKVKDLEEQKIHLKKRLDNKRHQ